MRASQQCRRRARFRSLVGMGLALAATPALADYDKASTPPVSSAMITTCSLGSAPLTQGSTPTAIAGVTIVSPQHAKCLMDRFSQSLLVIAVMADGTQLPDAYPIPVLGAAVADAAFTARVATDFTPLTGGNKARPILVYCHHASCQYSANAAEHLVNMGYTRIFWLRDGISGWSKAGYGFSATPRVPAGQRASVFYFTEARRFNSACFGDQKVSACRSMISYDYKSLMAADAKASDKPVILDSLLSGIAFAVETLRTGGRQGTGTKDLQTAVGLIEDSFKIMRQAQTQRTYPAVFANNQKLLGEAIRTYVDAGRIADANTVIQEARARADADFASLGTVRGDAKLLKDRLATLQSAEYFERGLATLWSKRSGKFFFAGDKVESAKALDLARFAFDRSAMWIARLDQERVTGYARGEYERLGAGQVGSEIRTGYELLGLDYDKIRKK